MAIPGPKTCTMCPSYITDPADQVRRFRKSIGAPVCGRFGTVLGRPGATTGQEAKLAKHAASSCPAFGEQPPAMPLEKRLQVALPDPDSMDKPDQNGTAWQMATTCGMCSKFIPDRVVVEGLGWTAGLCSAKGKLILATSQSVEARNCEYRSFGPVRNTTMDVHLLPEYEDAFNLSASPVAAYFKEASAGLVDPRDYETDKPVTQDETDGGIRAWRRVKDPDGSEMETYLPIYRDDFFSPAEQIKIPRMGDDEHPELYVDHFGGTYLAAVAWSELDETPALWGPAGTGKTVFRRLAYLMNLPFERISITGTTEVDDLIGKMLFIEGETRFQYGRLVEAWRKPCVLVIDEPNVGPAEVWQVLRPLTDNSKQLVVDQNHFERIPRNTDCYLGMAMNPSWDVRNTGANQIGDADASRLFHVWVEMPPETLEREMIVNRVKLDGWDIDTKRLDTLMRIAKDLRALSDDNSIPITWGIRPQIKVARAMRWFEPRIAYRRAIADYLEPETQQMILDVVNSHV